MSHKPLETLSIFVTGLVCAVFGWTFFGIGTVSYEYLDSMHLGNHDLHKIKQIRFAPHPDTEYVQNRWRSARALPPRVHARYFPDRFWRGRYAVPEEILWDNHSPDRGDVSEQLTRMFRYRVGEFYALPDAYRPYVTVILAAGLVAVSFFLVIAACVHVWFLVPNLATGQAKHHLLSATTLCVSMVCFFSKILFVPWMTVHPASVRTAINSFSWNPDSLLFEMSRASEIPATWSILVGLVCSLGLLAIAFALRFAGSRNHNCRSLYCRYLRTVVWLQVPIVLVYFLLCLVLEKPILPSMLVPDPKDWI